MTPSFTDDPPPCPFCDTASGYLGTLGRRDWWRCPGCGLDHDTPAEDGPAGDDRGGADDG